MNMYEHVSNMFKLLGQSSQLLTINGSTVIQQIDTDFLAIIQLFESSCLVNDLKQSSNY